MKVTFRLDDVSPHMAWDKFDALADLFKKHGVRPLLGVIPDNRDPELLKLPSRADGWERIMVLESEGWTTAQHGFRHEYKTTDAGLLGINGYSEFAGVDYETQLETLSEGQQILREHGLDTDIFMAPAHSFDQNTLKALKSLGFRYVTDGYSLFPYNRRGLKFIPCQTSRPRKTPLGLVTVCLHPNTMPDEALAELDGWIGQNRQVVCDYADALKTPGLGLISRLTENAVLFMRRREKQAAGRPAAGREATQ
jgi:predicted deacetylase